MKKVLSICYIIFFVVISVVSVRNDFQIDGYPVWMIISEVVIVPLGLVSMLLYTFSCKPRFCTWAWNIVPFMLVVYYLAEWYFDFIIFKKPGDTPQFVGAVTVLGLFLLFPLFYSSFKFGYSKDYL